MVSAQIFKCKIHDAKLRWSVVRLLVQEWGKSLYLVLHRAGHKHPCVDDSDGIFGISMYDIVVLVQQSSRRIWVGIGWERFGMSNHHGDNRCLNHPCIQLNSAFPSKIGCATDLPVHILLWTFICTLVSCMLVQGSNEKVWQHRCISSPPLVRISIVQRFSRITTSNLRPLVPTTCCTF